MTGTAAEFTPSGLGRGSGPHAHTPEEATALFGLESELTLLRLAYDRKIPHTSISREVLFTDEDLTQAPAIFRKPPTSQTHPTPSARHRRVFEPDDDHWVSTLS